MMDISRSRLSRIRESRIYKVLLNIRKDDAKTAVDELLARYHKEVFYRLADLGLNPVTDSRVRELDERIDILGNFRQRDYDTLGRNYIRYFGNAETDPQKWSRVIWDHILTRDLKAA